MKTFVELHVRHVELHVRHVDVDAGDVALHVRHVELDEFANSHGQVSFTELPRTDRVSEHKPSPNGLKWETGFPLSSHKRR